MAENVLFKRGLQKDVPVKSGAAYGTFYLTTDTHRLYCGNSTGGADLLSQAVITVDCVSTTPGKNSLEDQPKSEGQFYYVKDSNILAVYTGSGYVQINPDTKLVGAEFAYGSGKESGVVTVSMGFSQTSASGAKVDNIISTENIGFQAADNISLTTADSTDSAGKKIKVLKFTGKKLTLDAEHKAIKLGNESIKFVGAGHATVSADASTGTITIGTNRIPDIHVTGGAMTVAVGSDADKTGFEISAGLTRSESAGNAKVDKAVLDPIIKYGASGGLSEHFKNGTATLSVYSKSEVDTAITKAKEAMNAMSYKGTVGGTDNDHGTAGKALPTTDVSVGDTYIAYAPITIGDTTYPLGTMIIATSSYTGGDANNAGEVNGKIPAGSIVWSAVKTTDTDTNYQFVAATNGIDLVSSKTGGGNDTTGRLVISAGNDMVVSSHATEGGSGNKKYNIQTVTVKHQDFTTTTGVTKTEANNVTQGFNSDLTFTVFDPTTLTVDNGHITQLLTKTVTVKDSNVKDVSVGASTKSVANGTGVTVKTTVTTGSVSGGQISQAADLALTSTSLEIAKVGEAASTGEVSINLVWGTFGTAA